MRGKFFHNLLSGIAALALLCTAQTAFSVPYIPTNPNTVLANVTISSEQNSALRQLRQQLTQQPTNAALAAILAQRYIEVGRAEGDPRYLGYAEAVIEPWRQAVTAPAMLVLLRASIKESRHDFQGALADLDQLLKRYPDHAQAWLIRATIMSVIGKYQESLASCSKILNAASSLIAATCVANAASLSGRAPTSYQLIKQELARATEAPVTERLWALTVLADICVRTGRVDEADQTFRAALALGIHDVYLMGAYADFLLDQRRYADAYELLKKDTRVDGILLRLALAESKLQRPQAAQHIEELKTRFAANRLRGDELHLREEARFTLELLNDPANALVLANKNWAVQKEPADLRILVDAALAAKNNAAKQTALSWLRDSRLEDHQIRHLLRAENQV